jgi:hypothetical protein
MYNIMSKKIERDEKNTKRKTKRRQKKKWEKKCHICIINLSSINLFMQKCSLINAFSNIFERDPRRGFTVVCFKEFLSFLQQFFLATFDNL